MAEKQHRLFGSLWQGPRLPWGAFWFTSDYERYVFTTRTKSKHPSAKRYMKKGKK